MNHLDLNHPANSRCVSQLRSAPSWATANIMSQTCKRRNVLPFKFVRLQKKNQQQESGGISAQQEIYVLSAVIF